MGPMEPQRDNPVAQARAGVSNAIKDARYAARNRKIRTFFVSFPKTGRTWLRMMVGKVLATAYGYDEDRALDTFKISGRAVHGPAKFSHGNRRHLLDDGPHDALDFDAKLYRGKRVVYLIRDIRDTLVSFYFQQSKRDKVFEGDLSSFLRDSRFGARKIVRHYTLWFQNRTVPERVLLTRYETLRATTASELRHIVDFVGIDADDAVISAAVDHASFANMKKMESAHQFGRKVMQPGDRGDTESFKVRKGKVGGFTDYMNTDDLAYIDEVVETLGDPSCDWYFASQLKD